MFNKVWSITEANSYKLIYDEVNQLPSARLLIQYTSQYRCCRCRRPPERSYNNPQLHKHRRKSWESQKTHNINCRFQRGVGLLRDEMGRLQNRNESDRSRMRIVQLLECCDESLCKDHTRAEGGSLTSKSETDVLAAIRLLAVRDENTMVARVTLHNMRQEPIRNFGARLRGQAGVCKFFMQCPGCSKDVNYTDEILWDVTRGIVDTDVQLVLLGEGAIFDSLCASSSISQQHDGCTLSLDHHMYNEICDQWSKQTSQSQSFIKLQTTVHSGNYAALGFKVKISPRTASLPAMADTDCQSSDEQRFHILWKSCRQKKKKKKKVSANIFVKESCWLTNQNILHPLGLTEDNLIPVTMKMHAANNNRITILGATVLRFSGKSETDEIINTRQIVYITDSCSKIFLSREACVTLGIISSSFPTIGEATNGIDDSTLCCRPQRELPPQLTEKLPFTATTANHGKLRNFLLEHYKSSTFNTCEHQLATVA